MKFNFKKIASVLTSTVMLSSTIAFAAAANFPEPFIEDGSGKYAIVVGAAAQPGDTTAANQLDAFLKEQITETGDDSTPITLEGESFLLEKSSNKFNLGENLNAIYPNLDDADLPTLLAGGIYEDYDGEEYDYEQTITLGTQTLTQFENDDDIDPDKKPVIGFNMADGVAVLNYTLEFKDSLANGSLNMEKSYMTLGSTEYYISNVDASTANLKIELLDTANTAIVYGDEPITVEVGDEKYDVEIVTVDEPTGNGTPKATLKVNGEKLSSINEGNTKKIGDDTYLSIIDVVEATRESDRHSVEFSIGTGKIVLENGVDVVINEDTIDGLTSYLPVVAGDLQEVTLEWKTADEEFLSVGNDLSMPGMEILKLVVGDFVTAESEEFTIAGGDDYLEIRNLPVKGGVVSTLPILYTSNDVNFTGIGKDASNELVTNATANPTITVDEDKNSRFVATYYNNDEWETRVFEVQSVNKYENQNQTKIKDLASDEILTFDNDDSTADEEDLGDITLAVVGNEAAGTARVTITSTGTAYTDRVVTDKGLFMYLPVSGVQENQLNGTLTTWRMGFFEGDEDNNVMQGPSFNVTFNVGTDGPKAASVVPEGKSIEDGSDDKQTIVSGSNGHGTKILFTGEDDQPTAEIEYHGEEAYAKVYVAAGDATSSGGGSSSGALVVTDAEVEDVDSKNLIVIGGSCVNKVAAKLLGVETQFPVCGDAWETATGVGAGEFLIQTFASPYPTGTGKVAMLVAGYNQADTTAAEAALEDTETVVDTTAGKKYVQSPGSQLTSV